MFLHGKETNARFFLLCDIGCQIGDDNWSASDEHLTELSVGRNGEFAHILMEDVYWRTRWKVSEYLETIGI